MNRKMYVVNLYLCTAANLLLLILSILRRNGTNKFFFKKTAAVLLHNFTIVLHVIYVVAELQNIVSLKDINEIHRFTTVEISTLINPRKF